MATFITNHVRSEISNMTTDNPNMLTVKQIAEICNRTEKTVRAWIADFEIDGTKFPRNAAAAEALCNAHGYVPNASAIVHYTLTSH